MGRFDRMTRARFLSLIPLLGLALANAATALAAPALSSRPGAAYTVYLDFDGFNYTGNWDVGTPGNTPAWTGTTAQIQEVYARTAEKYAAFNVNVTTVDPAVAAGILTTNYSARQTYYDNTARMMHTVIGTSDRGGTNWTGGGGVSYVGTTQNTAASYGGLNGAHTNWVFTNQLGPNGPSFIAEAAAHENGHGLSLNHQSDVAPLSPTEYSSNGGNVGNGSYAPIMGNSYSSQRGTWRTGTLNTGTIQNDVKTLLSNSGMTLVDDGIGHAFASATALPLTGSTINSTLAQGYIAPASSAAPTALGIDNYTKDYFKFSMGASGLISLTLTNGGDWLTPGSAAVGATLRSKLNIYGASDLLTPIGFGTEAADTMSSLFSGTLAAGDYYAEITSFGGRQSTYDANAQYFDMGSYILSGTGILAAVPEPGTFLYLMVGAAGLALVTVRRRVTG